jgi:hypothetical protein
MIYAALANAGHFYTAGPDEQRREEVADWLVFLMAHTGMPPYRGGGTGTF